VKSASGEELKGTQIKKVTGPTFPSRINSGKERQKGKTLEKVQGQMSTNCECRKEEGKETKRQEKKKFSQVAKEKRPARRLSVNESTTMDKKLRRGGLLGVDHKGTENAKGFPKSEERGVWKGAQKRTPGGVAKTGGGFFDRSVEGQNMLDPKKGGIQKSRTKGEKGESRERFAQKSGGKLLLIKTFTCSFRIGKRDLGQRWG